MKNYFTLLLLLLCITGFSQTKSKEDFIIKRSEVKDMKLLSDLMKDLPTDNTVSAYEITLKAQGKLIQMQNKGNELSPELISLLAKIDKGSKLHICIRFAGEKKIRSVIVKIIE
ncbi:MAG: hypothetical protein V4506_08115 [Bacteroidota bacterium]